MRKLVFGLSFLALVAVGGWTALWFYAAHEAGAQLDAWLKTEDQHGRAWTCPDRSIGGYPLALAIACRKPTFIGRAPDQTVQGEVAGLVAEASLTHPKSLAVTLDAPLRYHTSDGQADVTAKWGALSLDLDGLPNVEGVRVHAVDLIVDARVGTAEPQNGNAATLDATFSAPPQGGSATVDFKIVSRGSRVPVLDELVGGTATVDLDLIGTLDQAVAGNARTPEEAIEAWRVAGGKVDLAPSRVVRGESSVSGTGTLRLDDAHRAQGRIDASFVGLEPILKRYGISGDLVAAGSLLNSLFGSKRPQTAPQTPGALNLPISFQDGHLGVGPVRTQIVLPPIY